MRQQSDGQIVARYSAWARVNHWIVAISFVLLMLSGLSMFHPSLFWLTGLFGGGQMTRTIHPWIGTVFAVSFLFLFIRFFRLNLWNNDDNRWLRAIKHVLNADDDKLPEVGKYNAGQKMVFWGQSILVVVLLVSGLAIWDFYFSDYTTVDQNRAAALTHSLAAVTAIIIWIVHVYAAIWVRGTVRAMTRGSVTGGWAWRHHRKWLRDEVRKPAVE